MEGRCAKRRHDLGGQLLFLSDDRDRQFIPKIKRRLGGLATESRGDHAGVARNQAFELGACVSATIQSLVPTLSARTSGAALKRRGNR